MIYSILQIELESTGIGPVCLVCGHHDIVQTNKLLYQHSREEICGLLLHHDNFPCLLSRQSDRSQSSQNPPPIWPCGQE
eukprot:9281973-Heterocapsa_arctica.AAC.1